MPRIRQYAERYALDDFWKEIDRCCPLAGIQSDNASALGKSSAGQRQRTASNAPQGRRIAPPGSGMAQNRIALQGH